MRFHKIQFVLLLVSFSMKAQYRFSGHVDNTKWHDNVYLSIIEDYRKINGIYSEQIISKAKTDSTGFFEFSGNQLENQNRIYRIHVDNCFDEEQNENHFNGDCEDSKEVIFIAKNNDTIEFPFSFEKEMFCDIKSNNIKTKGQSTFSWWKPSFCLQDQREINMFMVETFILITKPKGNI